LFIWVPIVAGYGTLKELQTEWSLYDVLDAHEVLEIKHEIETKSLEDNKNKRGLK